MSVQVTDEMVAAVIEHRRITESPHHTAYEPSDPERAPIIGDIAALLTHLQANPSVPSDEEADDILKSLGLVACANVWVKQICNLFQERQFAPKTPAVPDAVKEMIWAENSGDGMVTAKAANKRTLAVYELGLQMGRDGK